MQAGHIIWYAHNFMANATKCEQIKIFISHKIHLLKLLKCFPKIKMVLSLVSVKIEKDLQVFISFLFLISILHSISISFLLIYYRRKSKMQNEEAFIIFRHRQFIYVRTYIKYVKNKNFYKQNIIYPSKTTLCKM